MYIYFSPQKFFQTIILWIILSLGPSTFANEIQVFEVAMHYDEAVRQGHPGYGEKIKVETFTQVLNLLKDLAKRYEQHGKNWIYEDEDYFQGLSGRINEKMSVFLNHSETLGFSGGAFQEIVRRKAIKSGLSPQAVDDELYNVEESSDRMAFSAGAALLHLIPKYLSEDEKVAALSAIVAAEERILKDNKFVRQEEQRFNKLGRSQPDLNAFSGLVAGIQIGLSTAAQAKAAKRDNIPVKDVLQIPLKYRILRQLRLMLAPDFDLGPLSRCQSALLGEWA